MLRFEPRALEPPARHFAHHTTLPNSIEQLGKLTLHTSLSHFLKKIILFFFYNNLQCI